MKMDNDIELTKKEVNLPAKSGTKVLSISKIAQNPLVAAEAELSVELDRVSDLANDNPLNALDDMLNLMMQVDVELFKCYAPVLLEHGQMMVMEYQTKGEFKGQSRAQVRAVNSMHRVQESLAKLGAARVRVHDEIHKREQ